MKKAFEAFFVIIQSSREPEKPSIVWSYPSHLKDRDPAKKDDLANSILNFCFPGDLFENGAVSDKLGER
jgi:hypothetical protein